MTIGRPTEIKGKPGLEVKQKSVQELIDAQFDLGRPMDEIMDRFRNTVVTRALELKDGNVSEAARLVGAHRTSFVRWMKEVGIDNYYPVPEDSE